MAKINGLKAEKFGVIGALFTFVAISLYLLYVRCARNIILGVGTTFILYSTSGGDLIGSILAGSLLSLAIYFISMRRKVTRESFENSGEVVEEEVGEQEEEPEVPVPAPKPAPKPKRKVALPDNADRAEMFELGKKYKIPTENDDKEFHLDAGTTFVNAYKSLKPEQVAAMTKDTQELMDTQKQLMSTLQTLKPLISDGKQMMEMFQSYFGAGTPSLN